MQTKRDSILETALNILIGVVVVFLITGHLGETFLIVLFSFFRMYTLRRIFTGKS